MIGHSVLRFKYDGLCICIKVNNEPLHGRRVLSDYADSPLEKSTYSTVKTYYFLYKVYDDLLLCHCGYFPVG